MPTNNPDITETLSQAALSKREHRAVPTPAQRRYLSLGLNQAGGKLPLFDRDGQRFRAATIRRCIAAGWCEPWYRNPLKPDWLVCRLTAAGRDALR